MLCALTGAHAPASLLQCAAVWPAFPPAAPAQPAGVDAADACRMELDGGLVAADPGGAQPSACMRRLWPSVVGAGHGGLLQEIMGAA